MGARGHDELLKQALRERIIRHALWMPLDSDDPVGIAGPFDAFDGAVRGVRCDAEFFSRLVDGLVMAAVDMGRSGTDKLREKTSGGQNGVVLLISTFRSSREIGGSMWNGERPIGAHFWNVLNQRALEVDVEDLAAITDS